MLAAQDARATVETESAEEPEQWLENRVAICVDCELDGRSQRRLSAEQRRVPIGGEQHVEVSRTSKSSRVKLHRSTERGSPDVNFLP